MKKFFAILLALVMMLSLAACGGNNGDKTPDDQTPTNNDVPDNGNVSSSDNSGSFKYGFASWGTADEHGRTLNAATEWAVDAAGGEFVGDAGGFTAEATVASIENLISAGCQMVSFCTYAGEASVPTISDLCREKGVYWTMWDTQIADPEIAAYIADDPYYVGCTFEDNVTYGYDTMKSIGEAGATNVIIIRYGSGIPTCDERCDGGMKYASEAGITIVDDMIITDTAEYKNAVANVILSHPEVDGVFMAGAGTAATSVAEAFRSAGKDKFYIGAFDYFDGMGDMLKSGELVHINGGHMVTGTFSALMAINAWQGNPLSSDKLEIIIPYLTLKSYEDYEAYMQYASQGAAYTNEELQQFLVSYNSELTLESFQEGVSKWSVADIMARKNG